MEKKSTANTRAGMHEVRAMHADMDVGGRAMQEHIAEEHKIYWRVAPKDGHNAKPCLIRSLLFVKFMINQGFNGIHGDSCVKTFGKNGDVFAH